MGGSDGAGGGTASPDPSHSAGDAYGGPSPVAGAREFMLAFDGADTTSLVTVELINGSPCQVVNGTPVAWYENWIRA